ncbi:MAG: NUDIX domain-containing protein [Gammaproteobacteria bacterium]
MKRAILQLGIRGYRLLQRQLNAASIGVKGLVINPENEILLVEHTYCDGWYFPGGGVKSGETPFEALTRELEEETGVIVTAPCELYGIYYQSVGGVNDYPILFIVTTFTTRAIRLPNLEIKQMRWFSLNDLPPNITPCTAQRLNEIFHKAPQRPIW